MSGCAAVPRPLALLCGASVPQIPTNPFLGGLLPPRPSASLWVAPPSGLLPPPASHGGCYRSKTPCLFWWSPPARPRVPVKGSCAEGSRKIKDQIGECLGSKRLPASGNPIRNGGGLRPPTFLMSFPEAGGHLDPPNRPIWAFIFRLPSAPFYGQPLWHAV